MQNFFQRAVEHPVAAITAYFGLLAAVAMVVWFKLPRAETQCPLYLGQQYKLERAELISNELACFYKSH